MYGCIHVFNFVYVVPIILLYGIPKRRYFPFKSFSSFLLIMQVSCLIPSYADVLTKKNNSFNEGHSKRKNNSPKPKET